MTDDTLISMQIYQKEIAALQEERTRLNEIIIDKLGPDAVALDVECEQRWRNNVIQTYKLRLIAIAISMPDDEAFNCAMAEAQKL